MVSTPKNILAITNPLVAVEIQAWQEGQVTWEQALMNAVMSLQRNNDYLMDLRRAPLLEAAIPERKPLALVDDPSEDQSIKTGSTVTAPIAKDLLIQNRLAFFQKHGCWPEDPRARKLS